MKRRATTLPRPSMGSSWHRQASRIRKPDGAGELGEQLLHQRHHTAPLLPHRQVPPGLCPRSGETPSKVSWQVGLTLGQSRAMRGWIEGLGTGGGRSWCWNWVRRWRRCGRTSAAASSRPPSWEWGTGCAAAGVFDHILGVGRRQVHSGGSLPFPPAVPGCPSFPVPS